MLQDLISEKSLNIEKLDSIKKLGKKVLANTNKLGKEKVIYQSITHIIYLIIIQYLLNII